MKLHLPGGLRAALMACFAVVTGFATTLSTATIAGGVFAVSIITQAQAADVTIADGGTQSEFSADNVYYNTSTTVDGVTTWGSSTLDVGADDAEIYGINGGGAFIKVGAGTLTINNTMSDWWNTAATSFADMVVREGFLKVDAIPAGSVWGQSLAFTVGKITVEAGANLLLNVNDALGLEWTAVDSIIMKGEEGKAATMQTSGVVALHSALSMQGNTRVESVGNGVTGFDLQATISGIDWSIWQYSSEKIEPLITASGKNNIIEAALYERSASTIKVDADGSLTLAGGIVQRVGITPDGGVTKSGAGTLTVTGDLNLSKQLVVNEGILSLQGSVYGLGGGILLSGTGELEIGAGFVYMGAMTEADGYYSTGITVAGATADNVVFAGSSYSLDSNNVLVMQPIALTHSGTADWVWDFESAAFDNDALFKQGANVAFKGQSAATLGADIYAMSVNVDAGASLSISNAEGAQYDVTLTQLTNAGSLSIGADTMVGTYDAVNSTGTFTVGSGATLTVGKVSYGADKENVWNIFRAWDAQAGDTGLVVLQSGSVDFENGYHFDDVNHVTGRYYIESGFTVNCWDGDKANALITEVDDDAYLGVKGNVRFNVKQTVNVNGTLLVSGTLSMGHDKHDDRYYGRLTIGSTGAAVLNGLSFDTGGTDSYLKLDGGTLILGATGLTASSGKAPLVTLDSGVVASSAEGWSSNLAMTVGNVSFHTSQQEADAMKGTWADSTDAEGKAIASTITLGGNVTAVADTTLKVTGVGTLALNGVANTLANVQMDKTSSLNIGTQATVETLSGGNLSLAESATLTVNGEGSKLASLENKGTLNVQKGMTVGTYIAGAGSHIMMGDGAEFVIDDSARYVATSGNGSNFWTLLASGVDAEGNLTQGTISISGESLGVDGGADATVTYEVHGQYRVNGNVLLQNAGNAMSSTIGAGSSLEIISVPGQNYTYENGRWDISDAENWTNLGTGALWLRNSMALSVNGGALTVEGRLLLGHELNGGEYASSLTIDNDASSNEAVVALGGVYIVNDAASNALNLNGGKLILSGDMTEREPDSGTHIFLNGGALYSGADSWTSYLAMQVGDVTIDTTRQLNADGVWGDAMNGDEAQGATITLSGNVTATDDTTLKVVGVGKLLFQGADESSPMQATLDKVLVTDGATLALGRNASLTTSGIELKNGTLEIVKSTLEGTITMARGTNTIVGDASEVGTLAATVNNEGGVLTLNGVLTLDTVISNGANAKVVFGEDIMLHFVADRMTKTEVDEDHVLTSVTILTGEGAVSGVENLLAQYGGNATYENGVLTFTNADLAYIGSSDAATPNALAWGGSDKVFDSNGDPSGFSDGDNVTFSGYTTATLERDLSVHKLTLEEGARLELEGDYALNVNKFILNGTLAYGLVNGSAAVSASSWSVGENAAISLDLGKNAVTYMSTDVLPDGYTGNVILESGFMQIDGSTVYKNIDVQAGSTLILSQYKTYTGDVTLRGNGGASADWDATAGALTMSGFSGETVASISGKVTVAEEGARVLLYYFDNGRFLGDVDLQGTLTVYGYWEWNCTFSMGLTTRDDSGNILSAGDITGGGGIVMSKPSGTLQIGWNVNDNGALDTGDILLKDSTTLYLNHAAGTFRAADGEGGFRKANLTMQGNSTLHNQYCAVGENGFQWGSLIASGNTSIFYVYNGQHVFDELTSALVNGELPEDNYLKISIHQQLIDDYSWRKTQFNSINDYYGTIDCADLQAPHILAIGSVNLQHEGKTLTIKGEAQSDNFIKTGAGTLTIDALTINGRLTMNYDGTFNYGSLIVGDGSTLAYDVSVGDGLISMGLADFVSEGEDASDKVVKLDVSAITDEQWQTLGRINTGISYEVTEDHFSTLLGLKLSKDETTGTWWLSVDNTPSDVTWDDNWNLQKVWPALVGKVSVLSETVALYENQYYSPVTGATAIEIAATAADATGLRVYGGQSTQNGTKVEMMNGSWIKTLGGSYDMLIGGNRYGDFTGDTHIYVADGVSVSHVVGGNEYGGYTTLGNSYISIYSSSIAGTIAGGGFTTSGTSTKVGDSNIYVYVPLNDNSASSWGELEGWGWEEGPIEPHAVIGGHASLGGGGASLIIDGSTNITVDLSAYTGEVTEFKKMLIGGSYLWTKGQGTGVRKVSVSGDTEIAVTADDSISFSGLIIGDSYLIPGQRTIIDASWINSANSTLAGSTYITLNGGTYSGDIYGGTYMPKVVPHANYSGGPGCSYATIGGSTNLKLTSGIFKSKVIGGSFVSPREGSSTIIVGTNIDISGGSFSDLVIGGSLVNKDLPAQLANNSSIIGVGAGAKGTNVSFGGDAALQNAALVGGDLLYAGSGTIAGGTHISFTATGVHSGNIVGGSEVFSAAGDHIKADITGGSTIDFNAAGEKLHLTGAFYFDESSGSSASRYNIDAVTINLNGGNSGQMLVGGSRIHSNCHDGLPNRALGQITMGDIKVVVDGATVTGEVLGGSYNERINETSGTEGVAEDELSFISQGNVTVSLLSGTLSANVLAAGKQNVALIEAFLGDNPTNTLFDSDNMVSMTTASTKVELSSEMVLEGERTIRGGYNADAKNATVTGSKTLSFTSAETYSATQLGSTLFYDFDTVEVAKGGTVELVGAHGTTTQSLEMLLGANGGTLTKKGEGTFIMGSNMEGATVSVQGGTLKVNTSLTSVEVADGGTLDAAAASAGLGALTLRGTTTLVLDGATGLALGDAGAAGQLTLGKNAKLMLDVANASDERIVLFTGLSKDTISGITFDVSDEGITFAVLASYVMNSGDFMNGEGVLVLENDGTLVISSTENLSTSWSWIDTTGGTWTDEGTPEVGDWNHSTSPIAKAVIFGDRGMAGGDDASTTITIEGEVKPASILVNATHGTYVFTASATTPGSITGAATLTKEGAGTLRIENANSFSGGVILTEGVLEVANTEGLGKGVTRFNGGTLAYDLDAEHTVTGDELALFEGYTGTVNVALVGGPTDAAEDITWDFSDGASKAVLGADQHVSGEGMLTLHAIGSAGDGKSMTIADAATAAEGTTPATVGTTVKLTGSGITFAYSLEGQGTLEVASTGITTISGNNSVFGGTILLTALPGSEYTSFASNAATGGAATTLALNGACIVHATKAGGRYEAGTIALTGTNVLDGSTGTADEPPTRYIFAGDFVGGTTDSLLVRPGCIVEFEGSMADFSGTIGHDTQGNYADRTCVFRFVGKTPEGGEANTCKPTADGNIFGSDAKLDATGMNTTVTYEFAYSNETLNMNATVTGKANVTQSGTGTLVLTQANTATGTLTVNSGIVAIGTEGSVGNWSGDADVNGTGELHLVNVTGGTLAGAVTADADSTVKLQNSNGLTSISGGKLVVDGGSSAVSSTAETALEALQLVNGGSLSIGGDLAVKGSITSGGEDDKKGGNLTVSGGKLTIGSVNAEGVRCDSRLSVGGALSGVSQVVIKGNLGPLPDVSDALMSVGSFSPVSSNTLTFEFEDISQIRYMNLSAGDSYALLQTETVISDALAKGLILKVSDLARTTYTADSNTGDATYGDAIAVDDMDYSISWSSATNSVLLTATYNGNEWLGDGVSDGWDAEAADWSQGVPDAGSSIGFMGKGSTTVGVEEAKSVANMRVDADTTYTLQSTNNSTVGVSGNLAIANGGLVVDGVALSSASTVIGSSQSANQQAELTVGAAVLTSLPEDLDADTAANDFAKVGKLETGSLILHSTTGSFVNNGLTSVTGALITEQVNNQRLGLTNNGMLRMGDKSNVGTITGSGVVWATGGAATVAALDGTALAKASNGASLSVGRVNNALGFSLVDDTSSISILAGDVKASSLNSNGGLLNIVGKLTLERRSTSGGRVETSHLDLAKAGNSSFTSVKTDALTLNLDSIWDSVAPNTPLLSLTEGLELNTTTSLTLNLSGSLTDAAAKLGFDNATLGSVNTDDASGLKYTDYTLVGGASLAGLSYSVTDAANLQQAFALAGTYAEVVLDENNNLVLRVHEDDPRTWNGGDVFDVDTLKPSESDDRWAGNTGNNEKNPGQVLDLSLIRNDTALDTVDVVNITEDTTITVSNMAHGSVDDNGDPIANPDGLLINHLGGAADTTLTLEGEKEDLVTLRNSTDAENGLGSSEYKGTLVIDGMQVNVEGELGADNKPANSLTVGTTEFAGGSDSWLNVTDTADYRTGGLVSTAKGDGKISGTITVTGTAGKGMVSNGSFSGGYSGSYSNATVALADGADQRLVLGKGTNELSLISDPAGVTSANATLSYTRGDAKMGTIKVTNTHLTLDNMGAGTYNTLTVADGSTMTGGTLAINLKAADVAAGKAPTITSGLTLDGTKVHISQTDKFDGVQFNLADVAGGMTLFTLAGENLTQNIADYEFTGAFFERYFDTDSARVDANGAVKVDLIMDYYGRSLAQTENGTAALKMLDIADLELNPKGNAAQYKDLAGVMASLQDYRDAKKITNEGDKLAAAVAGSGVASLGMALSGDVERQLKAIRNRTTTMGVDPSVVNEDMPYFNAWINAEGDYRSMDDGGTLAGYTVNSYGGTVGFDMDVTPELTWGIALTAMYGDFESDAVDKVDGDMDTYYVSAFARATHGAWTHTFVATVGMSQSELSRTVSHKYGSYTTEGEADGMSFGFLYEAARTYALNEDATACWQPVFNVSFRHISVDGYEEEGSDAALKVGDQSLNTLTFGLGGRLQSIVGENVYNRTSVFEARALVKFDAGDRESEVENALINAPSASATVKSAELDAIGLEVGAGLTVPVGFDAGSIFVDGSLEFRGSYTNFNAAAGYRVNF